MCIYTPPTMAKERELDWECLENCVSFNLRWVNRAITQYFANALAHHGLLPTQTPILAAVAARPGAGMADLSDWLGMDRTTLLRNLRPLERDGFITSSGRGSGGKVSLELTAKGRAKLQKFLPDWRKTQRRVVETLGSERWSAILRDLERAALALQ